MSTVHLSAVSTALGDKVPLRGLDGVPPETAARLDSEGLSATRLAKDDAAGLATTALLQARARNDVPLRSLVISSTVIEAAQPWSPVEAGLPTVPRLAVGHNGCANLGPALQVAGALARGDDSAAVGVVLADDAHTQLRLMDGEVGVLADGAAFALVSGRPLGPGWWVRSVSTAAEYRLRSVSELSDLALARSLARQVRVARHAAEAEAGFGIAEADLLLMNNYTTRTLETIGRISGAPLDRLYDSNRATVGHCFGSDVLIDLQTLEAEDPPRGTRAVAVVTGPTMWSLIMLERS